MRSVSRSAGATWTRTCTSTTPSTRPTSRSVATSGSTHTLGDAGDSWDLVLARVAIDFRRELRLEDEEVVVSCSLERIGNSSLTLREQIRTRDGELAAEAEAVLVARDRNLGRSRPLSETERSAFERAL